jgi:hypothetical protein
MMAPARNTWRVVWRDLPFRLRRTTQSDGPLIPPDSRDSALG